MVTRLTFQDQDKRHTGRSAAFKKKSPSPGLLNLTDALKQTDQNKENR